MIGQLPRALTVNGVKYEINSGYRNILRIFTAFNANDLSDREKVYVCMKRLFVDLGSLPRRDFAEGYTEAIRFIECRAHDDKPSPRVVNWEKDEQLIFPAINKVAGMEVRDFPNMHWWTFLGHFQSIDPESVWGFVLMIRQKLAQGKPLSKHEKEFHRANRELCRVDFAPAAATTENALQDIFNSLIKGGDE